MFGKVLHLIKFSHPKNKLRFPFGKNWRSFHELVSVERIQSAEASLIANLGTRDLCGYRFLDVGCGSGLFSLAARNLGAEVYSFDYDSQSVDTTQLLKNKYRPNDSNWTILKGSVLDEEFVGKFHDIDIVYSWGVLHHTGDMYKSFENIVRGFPSAKTLFISIYNDQGWLSRYWLVVKYLFNCAFVLRVLIICVHLPYFLLRYLVRWFHTQERILDRGMDPWRDFLDWLGGYPFEVATPDEIINYFADEGYCLKKVKTVRSKLGCNEFIFSKIC